MTSQYRLFVEKQTDIFEKQSLKLVFHKFWN